MFRESSSSAGGGTFSSFRSPGFPMLWWAGLSSFISVQMQILIRGILAWDLTLREGALGLTYLCFGVTMLIATPLGGVASDRLPKRAVLLASQAVMTSAAAIMGVVVITGVVEYWMLLIAAMAQGAAFGFFGPARVAIASELVGRDQLGNAITLSLLSMNGTRVFAPALAGVLAGVAVIGIGGTYLISAACSLVGFVFMLRLPGRAGTSTTQPGAVDHTNGSGVDRRRPVNPLAEILAGINYVLARPPLRRMVIASFFVIMFGFNYLAFYPALVKGQFGLGDEWVGYISSASALGAVVVAIPLAARASSPWARAAMTVSGVCFGFTVIALGLAPNFWAAFAVIFFVGAAVTIFQSLSNTLALGMADAEHQGRVQSLMQLSFAGFGIAALPLGGLAEWIGLRNAIVVMGTFTAVTALAYAIAEGGWAALRPDPLGADRRLFDGTTDDRLGETLEDDVDLVGSPATRA
jgi:MFS family permease